MNKLEIIQILKNETCDTCVWKNVFNSKFWCGNRTIQPEINYCKAWKKKLLDPQACLKYRIGKELLADLDIIEEGKWK